MYKSLSRIVESSTVLPVIIIIIIDIFLSTIFKRRLYRFILCFVVHFHQLFALNVIRIRFFIILKMDHVFCIASLLIFSEYTCSFQYFNYIILFDTYLYSPKMDDVIIVGQIAPFLPIIRFQRDSTSIIF